MPLPTFRRMPRVDIFWRFSMNIMFASFVLDSLSACLRMANDQTITIYLYDYGVSSTFAVRMSLTIGKNAVFGSSFRCYVSVCFFLLLTHSLSLSLSSFFTAVISIFHCSQQVFA